MNNYTIKDLKEKGIPSRDFIGGMFYDWFCADSSLGRRGETCLIRLSTVVRACPHKFNDDDTIDFKNNCPCFGGTYDCVRVWDKDGNFKYAFVPKENGGGCSYMEGDDGEIVEFKNWNELKKSFCGVNQMKGAHKMNSKKKFVVSMAVDGRIDVEVEAENAQEAFNEAYGAFMDADLTKMDCLDAKAVNAYDVENDEYTDNI